MDPRAFVLEGREVQRWDCSREPGRPTFPARLGRQVRLLHRHDGPEGRVTCGMQARRHLKASRND
eukprot:7984515-Alexandrium_andersonii.AAC.1